MQKDKNYTHFIILPLKICGCWEWFQNPKYEYQFIINYVYIALVFFVLINLQVTLVVYIYTEWVDIMSSLEKLADGLPVLVSIVIVTYFALRKKQLYELVYFMNKKFCYHSARGLTNMTMAQSYRTAKHFAFVYTACTLFSVSMYLIVPVGIHLWTGKPLQGWVFVDVTRKPLFALLFLRQTLGQAFIGLAMGQLGVFFASNAILVCGQMDLLCCSLRNVRYTALLKHGVAHAVVAAAHGDIVGDERHNYIYSSATMQDSKFHYDKVFRGGPQKVNFDIYSAEYDEATMTALRDCARMSRIIKAYKQKFEAFVSPLLVVRVIQVTLYLCTLLYAATKKFDMITVEYLAAVALDIFVYCYYGSKIILQLKALATLTISLIPKLKHMFWRQNMAVLHIFAPFRGRLDSPFKADRVSTAAYQSAWHTMGAKPRRLLLNILLASRRPVVVRAGRFLPMDLHTFVVIIKTSFSYYTLLVNVNEKK